MADILDTHTSTTITFEELSTTLTFATLSTTIDIQADLDGWLQLQDEIETPIQDSQGWAIYLRSE